MRGGMEGAAFPRFREKEAPCVGGVGLVSGILRLRALQTVRYSFARPLQGRGHDSAGSGNVSLTYAANTMLLDAWSELMPRGRAQLLQLCSLVNPLARIRDKEGNQPELRETCFPAKGFVG